MLLRTRGDTSGVDRFRRAFGVLGAAIGGISFAALARGAIEASDSVTMLQSKLRLVTSGSEELAKVQSQVINLARQTRTDFSSVGELYARVARSSKSLGASQADVLTVTRAVSQAIQISGNSATEASAGMIQLAQALASGTLRGDELRSVLEQMPRVAEAIATGLGTTIGRLRELGQEGKLTSDLVFRALISQAGRLDSEFKKIQPTIGQSFSVLVTELKLATSELLKTTGTTDRLVGSINILAKAIRGIASAFKDASSTAKSFLEKLKTLDEKYSNKINRLLGIDDETFKRAQRLVINSANPLLAPFLALAEDQPERRTRGPTGAQRGRGRQGEPLLPPVVDIEEFRVTVERMRDDYGDVLREIENDTKTSTERQAGEFIKFRENLEFLFSQGLIDRDKFNERLSAAQDELLPEFDLNEIRAKYKVVKKETTELGEFMKGVWQQVGRSIQSTLSDAIYEWRLSWKSLLDIARRALADITAAIITSGIKNALKNAVSGSSGGSSVIGAFASALGFAAGGGRIDRPTIVGEEGRELVLPPARVMNQRQMAFAGGGGITFAPVTTVAIVERENSSQTKAELVQYFETRTAQQQAEFVRTLQRSGYEVRG